MTEIFQLRFSRFTKPGMQMLESQSRVLQAQFDARKEEIRQYYHSKAPIVKQIQEVDDELRRAQGDGEEHGRS